MSNEALSGEQFFHGTSVKGADSILREGARKGINVARYKQDSDMYSQMHERHSGGGVVMEGHLEGANHLDAKWGFVTTSHGAFVPKRMHYPDGSKVDLA